MKRIEKVIWLGLIPVTAAIWAARRLAGQPQTPAPVPAPVTPPAPSAPEDDLKLISGIGPVYEKRLKAAGVRRFGDLQAATPQRLLDIVQATAGLADTEAWIAQARQLASGS